MRDWTPTDRELPPARVEVATMDSSGHVQTLVREGRLWWFPDRSMYVYYTPKFWQALPEEPARDAR
jgi:hypothetical protein